MFPNVRGPQATNKDMAVKFTIFLVETTVYFVEVSHVDIPSQSREDNGKILNLFQAKTIVFAILLLAVPDSNHS